jgi:hypothetical protein
MLIGQQEPGRRDAEQLDTPPRQHMQKIDHIEVVNQRVGQLHEDIGQPCLGYLAHVHHSNRVATAPNRRVAPVGRTKPGGRNGGRATTT